jgi:hypothetical protein
LLAKATLTMKGGTKTTPSGKGTGAEFPWDHDRCDLDRLYPELAWDRLLCLARGWASGKKRQPLPNALIVGRGD